MTMVITKAGLSVSKSLALTTLPTLLSVSHTGTKCTFFRGRVGMELEPSFPAPPASLYRSKIVLGISISLKVNA